MNKAILHDHLDGGLRPSTALELAKNGYIEVKQDQTFGNIYVRVKQ